MRLLISILLFSPYAFAHYPIMLCEERTSLINCEIGFSDGSSAIGNEVQLISYEEEVLSTKISNQDSRVTFKKPSGEYYIYYDSGHEFPVEIDYEEL